MLFTKTNIETVLDKTKKRDLGEVDILSQVNAILKKDEENENRILQAINGRKDGFHNNFNVDLLESGKVYHLDHIKKICIDHRLRFLDTKFFKGDIPREAVAKIKQLEKQHQTELKGFKIIAPSKLFKLKKADDPLMFAPLGNDYFYLIHKWGNDLHPFRKLLMLPFKTFPNLMITLILMSYLLTLMIPDGLFSKTTGSSEFILVFLFVFKSVAAIVLFYGFALGKSFNSMIWNSKFDKVNL